MQTISAKARKQISFEVKAIRFISANFDFFRRMSDGFDAFF